MEFTLDFNYDEDVVALYNLALNHEFTSETRLTGTRFTLTQTENRLLETHKSKMKNGFDLHGILKIKKDGQLAGLCFPRKVIASEYDRYSLNPVNEYHRLSGIFVHPDFRGQGIAQQTIAWFVDHLKHILWTADESNSSSIKVATKANLKQLPSVDVRDQNDEVRYRLNVFAN